MDNSDKTNQNSDDGSQASRNRSFKSKQLVRSQAICESQSPPRTASPSAVRDNPPVDNNNDNVTSDRTITDDASSHVSDMCSDVNSDNNSGDGCKAQPVEIQITHGAWDSDPSSQRQRTRRWLGHKRHSGCRDLLSKDPRLVCVCGACAACAHCRGRKQRQRGPTKQDSGIVVSDECPDCSDSEQPGTNGDGNRKSSSLDVDDQYYCCRCSDRKDKPKNVSLSRYDSDDRELAGPDLVNFIKETLNKTGKDRSTLLKIEKELHSFINDTGRCVIRFPVMTSYGRMLVHRCAALFQLSHHLDQINKNTVIVSKSGTSGGRIPCTSFSEWCTVPFPMSPSHHQSDNVTYAKSILKRDTQSLDEGGASARTANRSKSLEQREREYERVRRRIFSTDNCNQDDSQWQWNGSGPIRVLAPEGRRQLLKVQSLESGRGPPQSWRSRGAVAKSHSFGGYGGGEQQPRVLSRQGNLAASNFLSPSSSGYQTLSLRSMDSITTSNGGASPESVCSENRTMMYTVTDVSAVPSGAMVLQAQSGQPLMNPDGTVYHFDPANPPVFYDGNVYILTDSFKDMSIDKRRPKLEKQDSFIDNDCSEAKNTELTEYHPSDDCHSKCSCDCNRQDTSQRRNNLDEVSIAEQKTLTPSSPVKNRYETQPTEETNNNTPPKINNHNPTDTTNQKSSSEMSQRQEYELKANQSQGYDVSTNQQGSSHQKQTESTNQKPSHEGAIKTFEATNSNLKSSYEIDTPPKNVYESTSNTKNPYEATAHPKNPYETTQPKAVYESTTHSKNGYEATPKSTYDPIPRNTYEMTSNPKTYEYQRFESQRSVEANQRPPSYEPVHQNKPYEAPRVINDIAAANQRAAAAKLANQENHDLQQYLAQQNYMQSYRNDEVASPQAMSNHYMPQELARVQNLMMHQKVAPVQLPDPNLRPVSLTNMMYPTQVPQGYPFVNQCRMDQQLQPVYQSIMQPQPDEQKQVAPSPHTSENTFRIDPSYPYAPMDYATCGACVDPSAMQPRSYNVSYTPVEMQPSLPAVLPPTAPYPVMQHIPYPYQEPVQWQGIQPIVPMAPKMYVPELMPVLQYPQYNVVYPQMIPQAYPYVQPMYPAIEQTADPRRGRSKHNSARATPTQTPPQTANDNTDKGFKGDTEIAVKIQQIKEQMAQMNPKDRIYKGKPEEVKRRNSGSGILGNYPANNHVNNRLVGRPVNDESQLSSTARAIVNSIRNMHPKNNYYQDNRRLDNNRLDSRPEYRPDRFRRDDRDKERDEQRRFDRRGVNVPLFRPPYLFRQMSSGTWCRRSPGPIHPVLNQPRRPFPDNKNGRR